MATGETRTIDSNLIFTSQYEMTENDDILNILNATLTFSKPAGDLFTNEGNDVVNITNSTLIATIDKVGFLLGSGDDTLNLTCSTIVAPVLAGSGNDTVVICGNNQNNVILKQTVDSGLYTLDLGADADILEICSVLDGDGSINFGTGTDTLRFNGGSLLLSGDITNLSILDVTLAGGSFGRNLNLTGTNTAIRFNGNLVGTESGQVISVSDSTTAFETAKNIRSNVNFVLNQVTLTQADGGSFEFSEHEGYAITANDSTITLHNIITAAGQVFTGKNTVWFVKDSSFANSTNGVTLTGGSLNMDNVSFSNYTNTAIKLVGTKLVGSSLAFSGNTGKVALQVENADMEITKLRMNGNLSSATAVGTAFSSATAVGGVIYHKTGSLSIATATLSKNKVIAESDISLLTSGNSAVATAAGVVYHQFGNVDLRDADLFENEAVANVFGSVHATATASVAFNDKATADIQIQDRYQAQAFGGGIVQVSGNQTMSKSNLSGNMANANISANISAVGVAIADAIACDTIARASSTAKIEKIHIQNEYMAQASGGGIVQTSGDLILSKSNLSGNMANANVSVNISAAGTATASATAISSTYSTHSTIARATARVDMIHIQNEYTAHASGGGIVQTSGNLTLTSAGFSGNMANANISANTSAYAIAIASACDAIAHSTGTAKGNFASAGQIYGCASAIIDKIHMQDSYAAQASGGGIVHTSGEVNMKDISFSGNIASASAIATADATVTSIGSKYHAFVKGSFTSELDSTASAFGGAVYLTDSIVNMTDVSFCGNIANASAVSFVSGVSTKGKTASYGGALYLDEVTLNYLVSEGAELSNTGNCAQYGGWLYMKNNSKVSVTVENEQILTIGDAKNNDSIGGTGIISKLGAGYWLINSDISGYTGQWTVSEGTLELARISRTILLDKWTFGADAKLILSNQNDTVNMKTDKEIGTLDLGGGSDVINTNGYTLSGGELLVNQQTFSGDGRITSTIRKRDVKSGFDLNLAGIAVDSDIVGGDMVDKITVSANSTVEGLVSLYRGDNEISGTGGLTLGSALTAGDGNDSINLAYLTCAEKLDLGSGNNTINISGSGLFKSTVTLGSGDDLLSFGSVKFMDVLKLDEGNNSLSVTGTGIFDESVSAGQGNDSFYLGTATFANVLDLGEGNNTLSINEIGTFEKTLTMGSGNDVLIFGNAIDNSGSVIAKSTINLGDGDNRIKAYGMAEFAEIIGGDGTDFIDLYNASSIGGEIALGSGKNVIYVEDSLTVTGAVKMAEGGETRIIVFSGTTLTDNTLTVYSDASEERETATYSWANQSDLDKVRLVVSSDSTFETFEFSVELYNNSKSFTLDLEKDYFVQLQANDEDGWKQRLFDDIIAPDQVTGVVFDGKTLSWNPTRDNLGGNGVKQYTVEVATDSSFSTIIGAYDTTETEYTPIGLENGTYYFRVKAEDYTQNIGEWSTAISGEVCITPRVNLMLNNHSQILAWDAEQGKVGYMATDGSVAPDWQGVWEWSEEEAPMWKVVGAGRFAGSTVEQDGVLLYNGYGNTFAAWTNLNDGSYGYVSLCHVDGNFQTKCLADFDGNGFDDVIIYDENGSVGIVSDAEAYHDVWHVEDSSVNSWQLVGAGRFGGDSDSIVFKNTSNNHLYLWDNNDLSYTTWNWSQTDIGSIADGWEVAAIGDFQNDYIDDIVLINHNDNDAVFVWDDGDCSTSHYVGCLGSGFKIESVGDYNGDGKEDLLLREYNSGWGGVGYWASADASLWTDLNARIENDMESKFAIIA